MQEQDKNVTKATPLFSRLIINSTGSQSYDVSNFKNFTFTVSFSPSTTTATYSIKKGLISLNVDEMYKNITTPITQATYFNINKLEIDVANLAGGSIILEISQIFNTPPQWGSISGNILTQTDLQNALNSKLNAPVATFIEQSSKPAIPTAGNLKVYAKNDNKLYKLDSTGTETEIGAGGGGSGQQLVTGATNKIATFDATGQVKNSTYDIDTTSTFALNSIPTTNTLNRKNNQILYVDDLIGDDTIGNGSRLNPFQTISHATMVANSDSVIFILGSGVMSELLPINIVQNTSITSDNIYLGRFLFNVANGCTLMLNKVNIMRSEVSLNSNSTFISMNSNNADLTLRKTSNQSSAIFYNCLLNNILLESSISQDTASNIVIHPNCTGADNPISLFGNTNNWNITYRTASETNSGLMNNTYYKKVLWGSAIADIGAPGITNTEFQFDATNIFTIPSYIKGVVTYQTVNSTIFLPDFANDPAQSSSDHNGDTIEIRNGSNAKLFVKSIVNSNISNIKDGSGSLVSQMEYGTIGQQDKYRWNAYSSMWEIV